MKRSASEIVDGGFESVQDKKNKTGCSTVTGNNGQTQLATDFSQQDDFLSEPQIESLKGFDKDDLKVILEKITKDASRGRRDALNAISGELANFSKEELQVIFQASPHTLFIIAYAASEGHSAALNAISGQLAYFSKEELQVIFQASAHTLNEITYAACYNHADALNAISVELANFSKEELQVIFQASAHTLSNIAYAASQGHPDALNAIVSSLNDVTDLSNQGVMQYGVYLNQVIRTFLSSNPNNRFLGLERAFCGLSETAFSRLTTGVAPEIILRLKRSTTWYKEFTEIFNGSQTDQLGMPGAMVQTQGNIGSGLCRFINDKVLQWDSDQKSRNSRISFVHSVCDYLTTMGYHHSVLDLNKICLTYQSGTTSSNGRYSSGYADSVLHEFSASLVKPSGRSLFKAKPESDSERDKRYKEAYGMLKSLNENLGLWIQFEQGRDPLSAQKIVVEHFKVFLRSYQNIFSTADAMEHEQLNMDYEQVNEALSVNNWDLFKSILGGLMLDKPAVNKEGSSLITKYFHVTRK